jgi:hypothetical protein
MTELLQHIVEPPCVQVGAETADDEVAKHVNNVESTPGTLVDVVNALPVGNVTTLPARIHQDDPDGSGRRGACPQSQGKGMITRDSQSAIRMAKRRTVLIGEVTDRRSSRELTQTLRRSATVHPPNITLSLTLCLGAILLRW